MSQLGLTLQTRPSRFPAASAVLQLLKPVTWFAPMWAFMCGVVSSGVPLKTHWPVAVIGIILAGPALCATSQCVNDWFDRHVDAINEPNRPIPSGRIPGRWGLWIAIMWTALSALLAATLGRWVMGAALAGLVLAWIYSAPPIRLKQRGWWGPLSAALCYEGFAWFTGAAAMSGGLPNPHVIALAALYSFGAIGIMILNDFKAVEGDRQLGILSVPVDLGVENAAWLSCIIMAAPQVVVVALLTAWGRPFHAGAVALSVIVQCILMARLLGDPRTHAPWYNATGTLLYVIGMLVSGFAISHLGVPS
jgi:chlorophyll synthase